MRAVGRVIAVILALGASGCGGGGGPSPAGAPEPVAPAAAPDPARVEGRPIARSLALATFDSAWDRIAHTHYDTSFRGLDWQGVREELRPRAETARTHEELRSVIRDMLGRLGESHYSLIAADVASAVDAGEGGGGGAGDVGMVLRIAEDAVVVAKLDPGGPAAAAGVGTGWVIEAIDGRPVEAGLGRLEGLAAGAERRQALVQFLWSVNGQLEGAPGSVVRVRARDGAGGTRELELYRRTRPGEPVDFGNLPTLIMDMAWDRIPSGDGRCVGLIRFNVWMAPIAPALDRAVDGMRDCAGIVVDLRGNPGGVAAMVMGFAGHFFTTRQPLGVLRTRTNELRLVANPRTVNPEGVAVEPYGGPVALLVDPLTVSTSEIFAAGMKAAGRARVFGETTAGQALPAMAVKLPNDDVLMHVVADLTVPGGERVEGRGVTPDVTVPLSRETLLAGRDAVLERAVQWIVSTGAGGEGGS